MVFIVIIITIIIITIVISLFLRNKKTLVAKSPPNEILYNVFGPLLFTTFWETCIKRRTYQHTQGLHFAWQQVKTNKACDITISHLVTSHNTKHCTCIYFLFYVSTRHADIDIIITVVADCHRYTEFGRAATERNLKDVATKVRYIGHIPTDDYAEAVASLRDMVYKQWDTAATSPPRSRPAAANSEAATIPDLQILAWEAGRPVFPVPLLTRFAEDTPEAMLVSKLKDEFDLLFPSDPADSASTVAPVPSPGRAGGVCDFNIDHGAAPLDINRDIDLACIHDSSFSERRCANGK